MKVKITATITYETEIFPEDYEGFDGPDAVIAYEIQQMYDEPYESDLLLELTDNGEVSNIKIEKIEEAAEQPAAA